MTEMFGVFDMEFRSGGPAGRVLCRRRLYNGVTLAALDYLHRAAFQSAVVPTYFGASAILSGGFSGVSPTDTAAGHPGWSDLTTQPIGGLERLARNPVTAVGATLTLQPFDAGSSIWVPNNTFVIGANLYTGLSNVVGTGLAVNAGTLLFCTAVLPSPQFVTDAFNPTATYVFVRVGYTLRGTPYNP